MKLQQEPNLPQDNDLNRLKTTLTSLFRAIAVQVNLVSEGRVAGAYNAATAAPTGTTVAYKQGDFIRNSAPTEQGSAGSKYVVLGWVCTVGGTPGTWKECRCLTGG